MDWLRAPVAGARSTARRQVAKGLGKIRSQTVDCLSLMSVGGASSRLARLARLSALSFASQRDAQVNEGPSAISRHARANHHQCGRQSGPQFARSALCVHIIDQIRAHRLAAAFAVKLPVFVCVCVAAARAAGTRRSRHLTGAGGGPPNLPLKGACGAAQCPRRTPADPQRPARVLLSAARASPHSVRRK